MAERAEREAREARQRSEIDKLLKETQLKQVLPAPTPTNPPAHSPVSRRRFQPHRAGWRRWQAGSTGSGDASAGILCPCRCPLAAQVSSA